MQSGHLTRRFVLLLPLAFAACGEEEPTVFDPLRYNYLPPIQLNVASTAIEQRFVPAGVPPDVSNEDPEPPVEALKAMASDRLQAFGTANKAVFAILDASLTRENDVVIGSMAVSLTILDDNGSQLGFAEARVQSRHTGPLEGIRSVLYDMTKSMMSDMNVEFEYQVRRNLKDFLTNGAAPDTPVQQAPLDQQPPQGQPQPGQPQAPQQLQPQPFQPQGQPQPFQPQGQPQQGQPIQLQPQPGQPPQLPPEPPPLQPE
jgi:hypothetical protein